MAWEKDLVEACYTAPSGKKFYFNYDSKLNSEIDLKTATFTFPEKDGALVVPLGIGGRRFSFTCYFYGIKSKKQADDFEEGLKERGYGELQHPLYGTFKVVPTGEISRSDDVVSGLGVSSISITFAETIIETSILNSEIILNDAINFGSAEFEKKSVLEFCKSLSKTTIKGVILAGNMFKSAMEIATELLISVAKIEQSIYTKFQLIESELDYYMNNLVSAAEDVSVRTVKLFKLPAQSSANIATKIATYSQIAINLINKFKNDPAGVENAKNQWAIAKLMLESLILSLSSGIATIDKNAFKSREEAINTVTNILEIYDSVVDFEEKNVDKDFFVETGESFSAMRDVVSLSVKQIVENSFSLPTRKSIVLGKDRQIVELIYDLYGNLEKMDEFIIDNNINYNELEVISMGRKVFYYV